jgi:hypothetical protein
MAVPSAYLAACRSDGDVGEKFVSHGRTYLPVIELVV